MGAPRRDRVLVSGPGSNRTLTLALSCVSPPVVAALGPPAGLPASGSVGADRRWRRRRNTTRLDWAASVLNGRGRILRSNEDAYRRILASLSDAMLDNTHWPATSALIDEACGLTTNALLIGEGPRDDMRVLTVGFYSWGQRHEEQERDYLRIYHPVDERVPRVRWLPDSRLMHVTGLYTAEELKTSPTQPRNANGMARHFEHRSWTVQDRACRESQSPPARRRRRHRAGRHLVSDRYHPPAGYRAPRHGPPPSGSGMR